MVGRRGIVTEIDLKYTSDNENHVLCIADIQLRSAFCQIMSFGVAGGSLLKTRGDGVEPEKWVKVYEDIGEQLSRFAVRVLAGEFRDHSGAFRQEMRKQACINIAAWLPYKQEGNEVCVSSSYMFFLGQVKSLHLAFTGRTLWEREPNSRGNGSEALPARRADMGDSWTSTPLEDLSWPALPARLKDIFRGKDPGFFCGTPQRWSP